MKKMINNPDNIVDEMLNYQNEEYAILKQGTDYGVALYDHIALKGNTVKENDLIH